MGRPPAVERRRDALHRAQAQRAGLVRNVRAVHHAHAAAPRARALAASVEAASVVGAALEPVADHAHQRAALRRARRRAVRAHRRRAVVREHAAALAVLLRVQRHLHTHARPCHARRRTARDHAVRRHKRRPHDQAPEPAHVVRPALEPHAAHVHQRPAHRRAAARADPPHARRRVVHERHRRVADELLRVQRHAHGRLAAALAVAAPRGGHGARQLGGAHVLRLDACAVELAHVFGTKVEGATGDLKAGLADAGSAARTQSAQLRAAARVAARVNRRSHPGHVGARGAAKVLEAHAGRVLLAVEADLHCEQARAVEGRGACDGVTIDAGGRHRDRAEAALVIVPKPQAVAGERDLRATHDGAGARMDGA